MNKIWYIETTKSWLNQIAKQTAHQIFKTSTANFHLDKRELWLSASVAKRRILDDNKDIIWFSKIFQTKKLSQKVIKLKYFPFEIVKNIADEVFKNEISTDDIYIKYSIDYLVENYNEDINMNISFVDKEGIPLPIKSDPYHQTYRF